MKNLPLFDLLTPEAPPPTRITLSREAGWRMPPNTAKVDRTTKFGNPFWVDPDGTMKHLHPTGGHAVSHGKGWTTETMLAAYYDWLRGKNTSLGLKPPSARDLMTLRGKNLACWCKQGAMCHGEILLSLVNSKKGPTK